MGLPGFNRLFNPIPFLLFETIVPGPVKWRAGVLECASPSAAYTDFQASELCKGP